MAERNYRKRLYSRTLRKASYTPEESENLARLAELRRAIEGITVRKWTDDEWYTWLRTFVRNELAKQSESE